jgi:hypothetical protein
LDEAVTVYAFTRCFVFRFQANGNHDADFAGSVGDQDAGTFFPPTSLVIQPDGRILLAGHKVTIGGSTPGGILRLNADGNLDAGFLPEPRVSASFIYAINTKERPAAVPAGGRMRLRPESPCRRGLPPPLINHLQSRTGYLRSAPFPPPGIRGGGLISTTAHTIMGSLKKRRKTKINKHKRKKRMRANRHKKRLRYKS